MKTPLVTRKKYENELYQKEKNHGKEIARLCLEHDRELEQTKAQLKDLIPKLLKINVEPAPYEFKTYRLCVEFSTQMIEQAFMHGNDRKAIQWICEDVAHKLEREMFSINFTRGRY